MDLRMLAKVIRADPRVCPSERGCEIVEIKQERRACHPSPQIIHPKKHRTQAGPNGESAGKLTVICCVQSGSRNTEVDETPRMQDMADKPGVPPGMRFRSHTVCFRRPEGRVASHFGRSQ